MFKFDESPQPHNDGYGIYDCAGVNRLTFTDAPGRVWCIGYDEAKRIENQFNGVAQNRQTNL